MNAKTEPEKKEYAKELQNLEKDLETAESELTKLQFVAAEVSLVQ